ncbi:hypothetical protein D3P07_21420 [Paenibacillus sp. 1011MAR3C5]|uniref:hypothetical protein n=1 Tax=Paenibacillus sp. 1011MAR3C5 TaxID=1675787 RepID=UPI000E6CD239|nr:hypothetical protein [Paenibacillus sp. 1011MAR3C5]RJE85131.1 hypothetical protein D3P07_21420 [Paenibacillus sp. 1011MAR3C5]
MRKPVWLAMVMLTYWLLQPGQAMALTCVEPGPIDQRYETYDGVIVAKVLNVKAGKEEHTIQLEVKQSFKGIEVDRLTILEDRYWEKDSRESKEGEEYLYYLKNIDSHWENQLCSPTVKLSLADAELDYLKDKELQLQPASELSTVEASHAPAATDTTGDDAQSRPIANGSELGQSSDSGMSTSAGLMVGLIAAIAVILVVVLLGMRRRK